MFINDFSLFLNEKYESGVFDFNGLSFKLDTFYDNDETYVRILYMDKHYEDLSVIVPKSKILDTDEFFLNPNIDKEMVNVLIDQGFIECTNKKTMAGDKLTKSYMLV